MADKNKQTDPPTRDDKTFDKPQNPNAPKVRKEDTDLPDEVTRDAGDKS